MTMTTTLKVDGSKVSYLDATRALGANTDMHTVRALHTAQTQTYGSLEGVAAEIVAEFHAEIAGVNAVTKYGSAGIGERALFFLDQHAERLAGLLETATVGDLCDVVNWQDDQVHNNDDLETKIFHTHSRGAFERLVLSRVTSETDKKNWKENVASSAHYAAALEKRRPAPAGQGTSTTEPKLGARVALRCVVEEIDAFEAQCSEAEYTDTDEVWALLEGFRSMARDVA